MAQTLRILFVEDSEDDRQLILRSLKRNGIEAVSERVETADTMRHALANQEWDLIISDYSMPRFNAPQALEVLKSTSIDLPFIIVSGTIGEETAVAALKSGAHDFLVKGNLARLAPAIQRELRDSQIRRDHRKAEEALREKERLLSEAQRIGHVGSWSLIVSDDTLQFSEEMYHLLDITRDEFDHHLNRLADLSYPTDKPVIKNWVEELKTGRRVREMDIRIFHKNGELRYIRFTGEPIFDATGGIVRITGNTQDVTESKLAEIQIQQQLKRLTSLRTIDQAITSSFNLKLLLNTVISQTIDQLQVDAADILILNENAHLLEYFTGLGFQATGAMDTSMPLNSSHAGRVVLERRLIQIADLKEQPLSMSFAVEEGFTCYCGVPLVSKGKVKGVLEVFHRSPLQPYPEWIEFLETLAGQAAIAIDNVALFEKLAQSNFELRHAYDATIKGWSHALDLRDKETEGHTQRVTEMSIKLAQIMNLSEEQLVQIRRGGLLHDIGKMGVPDHILLKPGPLTENEWKIMRTHPKLAYDWLAPITYLQQALEIPYCHHEKWDGTGYPRGLKGEDIPFSARIFAVVDVWDALTSNRPYRAGWDKEKTLEYIREQSGKHFDPQVADTFLQNIDSILE